MAEADPPGAADKPDGGLSAIHLPDYGLVTVMAMASSDPKHVTADISGGVFGRSAVSARFHLPPEQAGAFGAALIAAAKALGWVEPGDG